MEAQRAEEDEDFKEFEEFFFEVCHFCSRR
jgi:hypothetical protein